MIALGALNPILGYRQLYPMKKRLYLFFVILVATFEALSEENATYDPLYAGTLLAFYPSNAEPGRMSIQPYLFASSRYGIYNHHWRNQEHSTIVQEEIFVALETGITKSLDISMFVSSFYSQYRSQKSVCFDDLNVYLGWQLSRDKKGTWIPDSRLLVGEIFPTGKFQHLDPKKGGSDISGAGSYQTSAVLVLQKIFYTFPNHPYNVNLNLIYIVPTKVETHGLNLYGDGHGVANPGNHFIANLGYEFSFTKNWGWGIDLRYEHQNKSPFKLRGSDLKGGLPSSEVFSLAPSLEYNWSTDLSVAWGAWFSIAGRNAEAFASGVFNVFYYF